MFPLKCDHKIQAFCSNALLLLTKVNIYIYLIDYVFFTVSVCLRFKLTLLCCIGKFCSLASSSVIPTPGHEKGQGTQYLKETQ